MPDVSQILHMRSSQIPHTSSQIPHMRSSQNSHTRTSQIPPMFHCAICARGWVGGWGAYSFVTCLNHLTIDHASLSSRRTVPTPNRDTFSSWAAHCISSIHYIKSVAYLISFLFGRLKPPSISYSLLSSLSNYFMPQLKDFSRDSQWRGSDGGRGVGGGGRGGGGREAGRFINYH